MYTSFVHNFQSDNKLTTRVQNVCHLDEHVLSVSFPLVDGRVNNVLLQTARHQRDAAIKFILVFLKPEIA